MKAKVLWFPEAKSRLFTWSKKYVDIYQVEGWLGAGKYFEDMVPEPLRDQMKRLIEKEFLRRGIYISF